MTETIVVPVVMLRRLFYVEHRLDRCPLCGEATGNAGHDPNCPLHRDKWPEDRLKRLGLEDVFRGV